MANRSLYLDVVLRASRSVETVPDQPRISAFRRFSHAQTHRGMASWTTRTLFLDTAGDAVRRINDRVDEFSLCDYPDNQPRGSDQEYPLLFCLCRRRVAIGYIRTGMRTRRWLRRQQSMDQHQPPDSNHFGRSRTDRKPANRKWYDLERRAGLKGDRRPGNLCALRRVPLFRIAVRRT